MASKYGSKHPDKARHPVSKKYVKGVLVERTRSTFCTNCGKTSFENKLLSTKCSCGGSMQILVT